MRPVCVLAPRRWRGARRFRGRPPPRTRTRSPRSGVRTGAQILGFLGLDFALLYLTAPPAADPPGNVRPDDKLRLRAWSFDASAFATNSWRTRSRAPSSIRLRARIDRTLESLAWASLASLTWSWRSFPRTSRSTT